MKYMQLVSQPHLRKKALGRKLDACRKESRTALYSLFRSAVVVEVGGFYIFIAVTRYYSPRGVTTIDYRCDDEKKKTS